MLPETGPFRDRVPPFAARVRLCRRCMGLRHDTTLRVMSRLNLTLDEGTSSRLEAHARRLGARRATLAASLLKDALDRQEVLERRKKLAADYAADRDDARDLLQEIEAGQMDSLE